MTRMHDNIKLEMCTFAEKVCCVVHVFYLMNEGNLFYSLWIMSSNGELRGVVSKAMFQAEETNYI